MGRRGRIWKQSRYEAYYRKKMGQEVYMPITRTKRYGLYYQKMMGQEVDMPVRVSKPYVEYYRNIYVYPQNEKNWKEYLRRIVALKKTIKLIGKVPEKESMIKESIKYFTKLAKAVTEFNDAGLLEVLPVEKHKEAERFGNTIIILTCRESAITISWKEPGTGNKKVAQYWNMSKENEILTYNNLHLGMFSKTTKENDGPGLKARIEDERYNIDVVMSPISEWMSSKVKEPNGKDNQVRKEAFSEANLQLTKKLLKVIDEVLE
ncbi:MAG: hypothetical protein HFJ48_02780 [Clostridia bacterium]|nr:hypothetical protein [Clostridia bacterium]